jgi:type IV secretory pathway VirB2 component (pilin)
MSAANSFGSDAGAPAVQKELSMNRKIIFLTAALAVVVCFYAVPAFADGGGLPWETPFQVIVNALNGSTGTLMSILAVMVVGVLALAGRVSWAHAGAVLFGIVCIFGAARIVGIFNG